jgi:predicted PurR-regulated permease PerM
VSIHDDRQNRAASMNFARPITFWIAMCAAVIAAVVLLREILLPFVAGLVLAYLFNPRLRPVCSARKL